MNFTSGLYILFIPIVCILHWLLPVRMRQVFLLAASYGFYMSWRPLAAVLLLAVTLVTFAAGRGLAGAKTKRCRFLWGFTGVFFPLLMLILFKNEHIALVAGISFYTFQSLSYVLEVYRGSLKAEKSFWSYALYVAFFPQLVAGPIERPGTLLAQLKGVRRLKRENLAEGCGLLLRGYFKKLVLADLTAVYVDRIFQAEIRGLSGWAVGFGAVLFALQIYGDFSGYSDIARGCALFFDVRLSENFRMPYAASSIGDFWRRWHITLTEWFTDYVYIPLGGNRKGQFRTLFNTLLVFLLSGLWHGLGLHYVLWGLLHAMCRIGERLMKQRTDRRLPKPLGQAVTFGLVCLSWIFFRAGSAAQALGMLRQLGCGWGKAGFLSALSLMQMGPEEGLWILLSSFMVYRMDKAPERTLGEGRPFILLLGILAAWMVLLLAQRENAFLYFRF